MPEDSITNFKRQHAAGATTPAKPYPPFPPIPSEIKNRFPDLQASWDAYEKSIAEWVRAVQTN